MLTWRGCALCRYPGNEKNTLEDISLSCTLNSRVAVLGPNGAGKSTMIKVRARGADVTASSPEIVGSLSLLCKAVFGRALFPTTLLPSMEV